MSAQTASRGPFEPDAVEEIVLKRAPLVRVLAQVRFPRLTRLVANNDVANLVAVALVDEYPTFNESREISLTVTLDGVTQTPTNNPVWNLVSADREWQVSFGAEFLTLHTSAYTSRDDFVARFRRVVDAFAKCVSIPSIDRVGVRYINRVELGEVSSDNIREFVRPEMHGGIAVPLPSDVTLRVAMNEALFDQSVGAAAASGLVPPSDGLQARWGLVPAGAQVDVTLPPAQVSSWLLDLDAFTQVASPFGVESVGDQVTRLAERAYSFFRWVVTDAFVAHFGGDA